MRMIKLKSMAHDHIIEKYLMVTILGLNFVCHIIHIPGLSVSGKVRLAFDTLYAAGQRTVCGIGFICLRSSQFLVVSEMDKPDVDSY